MHKEEERLGDYTIFGEVTNTMREALVHLAEKLVEIK